VNDVENLTHISEKPWSAYTEADYTLEQWHKACLVHMHDGAPTSKTQCKLPVKTPNGAVNRNGVHAAAAALAGARSELKASSTQKSSAASSLRSLYNQLGEKIPPSLAQSELKDIVDFIEHHGTKGMKWGVRKSRSSGSSGTDRTRFGKAPKRLTNEELDARIKRMENEKKYNSLNKKDVGPGQRLAAEIISKSGKKLMNALVTGALFIGTREALKKTTKLSEEHIQTLTKMGKG
jgi:hypothetical protein